MSDNHIVSKKILRFIVLILVILICNGLTTAQETRQLVQEKPKISDKWTALVIGNGHYQRVSPLDNPVNDATDIAAALEALGFTVIKGIDKNRAEMRQLIREFGEKLAQKKGVGLFYYAGHGVEVRGRNFLVPVDADIAREAETEDSTIDLNSILRQMDAANNGFNIVILDACRNNPFSRGWSRSGDTGGLANVNAPTGTYIAFAAAPGSTASDGKGTRNGIFTGALLKNLKRPNLKLEEVFKATREEVMTLTDNKQVPWDSSSIKGDFYFSPTTASQTQSNTTAVVPKPMPLPTPLPTPTPVAVTLNLDGEGALWQYVTGRDTQSVYESYLLEYPSGKYVTDAKNKIDKFKQAELVRLKDLERTKWRETQNLDSKDSYNAYLAAYPNGEFVSDARSAIRTLDNKAERAKWNAAQSMDTKDAYNAYLKAYPKGEFVANARSGMNELETKEDQTKWDEVQILNRKTAFQSYLSSYPYGKYAATAKQRIQEFDDAEALKQREKEKATEKAKWDDAERLKTVVGYKDYLTAYPKGEFASLARLRSRDLGVVLDAPGVTSPSNAGGNVSVSERANPKGLMAGMVRRSQMGIEMVWIPPGEFMMGSTEAEVDEAVSQGNYTIQRYYYTAEMPKRKVTISEGFWIGQYEVTQGQWQAVMDDNPSGFKDCGANCPVERVTWDDIQVFLKRLNAKNDGFEYSLPSEGEWEYAARAGTTTAFAFGDSLNSSQANFAGECPYASTKGINIAKTVTVGKYKPNAWGLYDMHGNVWELVLGDGYIRRRGGGYDNCASSCRSAVKSSAKPADRNKSIGFRVAARLR